MSATRGSQERRRNVPEDYIFGKLIGEGSFSTVFLVRENSGTKRELACKVCDKLQIKKENKTKYIISEKEILVKLNREWNPGVPFFVRLYSTFQDAERLYFVMTYARNGDLLGFIDKLAESDIDCTQFYAAELVSAIEHLHNLGIIHRDLKPENILLNERMHILITDFGSAKQIETSADRRRRRRRVTGDNREEDSAEDSSGSEDQAGAGKEAGKRNKSATETRIPDNNSDDDDNPPKPKRKSFVGTPQYVSPEILTACGSSTASDLWALGCIIYQMITGGPPFQSASEYLIFKKIQKLDYSFQEGFNEEAKDLIRRLLVIEPKERIGAKDEIVYTSLREHAFFRGVDFGRLQDSTPSTLAPFLPTLQVNGEPEPDACWSRIPTHTKPGAGGILRLMVENEGIDDDTSLDEVLLPNLPPPANVENNVGSGTLTERPNSDVLPADSSPIPSNRSGGSLKTKKNHQVKVPKLYLGVEERQKLFAEQEASNKFHKFVEGNFILKQGVLDKKKGLLARRRMFLLTDGSGASETQGIPHLYYIDPEKMVLKGEIPWSRCMKTEIRDPRIFFVHTVPPRGRVYYLLDPNSSAQEWCLAIEEVRQFFYENSS